MSDMSNCSNPGPAVPAADADWPTIRDWRKQTRTKLIEQRIGISAEDRAAWSERISRTLGCSAGTLCRQLIGFYWPFRGEYDPRDLMATLRDRGTRLALPVIVEREQPLVFREWSPGSLMTQGVWNVPTPESGEAVLPVVLVVPLVGFDAQGYRLGYGGGFYGRTIAAMPTKPGTIGVGFELGRLPDDLPAVVRHSA